MKILRKDLKRGVVAVRVEDEDDLWVLKNVIKEGDIVVARTLRDVKMDGEGKRRLPMTLAIKVENVRFQPFSSRLRVHGVIIEGPEEYGLRGSYHTFNVDVGSELEIIKESWDTSLLRRLERASTRGIRALLVAIDFDELAIAMLYNQGVKYLLEKSLPGINKNSGSIDDMVDEVIKALISILDNVRVDAVVIGSPAFIKDVVASRLSKLVNVKVFKDSISNGGRAGIEELLRRDSVKNLLRELDVIESERILNEFMELLIKNPSRVAYGINDVRIASTYNAVAKLLVIEELLSESGVEGILSSVEERGGEVRIVSNESPASTRLKGLGGIIAILRYELSNNIRSQL